MDEYIRPERLSYILTGLEIIYVEELDTAMFFVELITLGNTIRLITDIGEKWLITCGHRSIGSNIEEVVRDAVDRQFKIAGDM